MDESFLESEINSNNAGAYDILIKNIDKMIELIVSHDGTSKQKAREQLGLNKATLSKWKNGKHCPSSLAMEDLFEKYNGLFEPSINQWTELRDKYIEGMHLLKDDSPYSKYKRFLGNYYIYYFSDHYKKEIHCGKLRITFNETTQKCLARMVIGIRNPSILEQESFSNIFSSSTDEETQSYQQFKEYKKDLHLQIDNRCYYYEGSVDVTDMIFRLKLHGSEHRLEHKQDVNFCIKRIRNTIDLNTRKTKLYNGGIGMVIAYPNKQHRTMRLYRMGISRWPIDINNKTIKHILNHSTTDTHRVILSDDDDKRWYDYMLLYEGDKLV